jgi:hypothetical protein
MLTLDYETLLRCLSIRLILYSRSGGRFTKLSHADNEVTHIEVELKTVG